MPSTEILVEKVHGLEDPEVIHAAALLCAWLRGAGRVRLEDFDGIVLEVPLDFDVCTYVESMPKISKVVNPSKYRCVERLGQVKVYYGRKLVARILYQRSAHLERV